jgi:site-specific DNA-methyltransferase (adenine-specific)
VLPTLPEASVDFVVTDPPYGLGFMGHDWDHGVPGVPYWQAIIRVCKPGALLLAFGGTRTYHRLTCAIEDAGWEIRDCLMWLYGSGMPKCGDIGKLIDKAKGAKREVVGTKLGQPGYSLADNGRTNEVYGNLHNPATECAITAPATELGARFTGWAMALKPAFEPIILAMKSMDGTIAHNAETWDVAGMNIDACRIPTVGEVIHCPQSDLARRSGIVGTDLGITKSDKERFQAAQRESICKTQQLGRWPANLLLDEEAAALLDEQTGTLKSGLMKAGQQRNRSRGEGGYHGDFPDMATDHNTYGDTGGASRFFYVAKAAKKERNPDQGPKNDHPTVKPLKLMEYLLTLLSTPTGGVVLDPFAGSGSTLLAAKRLGRPCIGIELEEHNCEIAVSRLKAL